MSETISTPPDEILATRVRRRDRRSLQARVFGVGRGAENLFPAVKRTNVAKVAAASLAVAATRPTSPKAANAAANETRARFHAGESR